MLNSILSSGLTVSSFFICTAVSLVLGVATALLSGFRARTTKSFAITLAVLPAVVQVVLMLVNGNLGAGVAVAGAFSLVRFRSAPGNAREIAAIFLAMALGLATGMGYVVLALVFFAVVAAVFVLLTLCHFGGNTAGERTLKITIPENIDYEGVFDDLLARYTKEYTLDKVKTTNMGSLFELHYRVVFRDAGVPKAFLDELRCRNGNLPIVCGRETEKDAL